MKAIIIAPDEIPVRAGFFTDFEDRLVSGELTADGIQWSPEITSGGAGVDVDDQRKSTDFGNRRGGVGQLRQSPPGRKLRIIALVSHDVSPVLEPRPELV